MATDMEVMAAVKTLKGLMPRMTEQQVRRVTEMLVHADYQRISGHSMNEMMKDYAETHEDFNLASFRYAFGTVFHPGASARTREQMKPYNEAEQAAKAEWEAVDAMLADYTDDELRAEWKALTTVQPKLSEMFPNVDVTNPKRKGARGALAKHLQNRKAVAA